MFGKWKSEEDLKAEKAKKKARKDLIFELTQNSIVHKLREDVERITARANHFENEWFILKKTNEVLTGQLQTIAGADQELKAEMYEMTKAINFKNQEITSLNFIISEKDETIGEYSRLTEESIDKIAELTEENKSLKLSVKELEPEITTEYVND